MRCPGVRPWLVLAALGTPLGAQGADDRPVRRVEDVELQRRINAAVESGVAYLERAQNDDGSWTYDRPPPRRPRGGPGFDAYVEDCSGGLTALALYALAASGVRADDPAIERGLRWTEAHERPFSEDGTVGTYSASLLVLALTRIDAAEHRRRIHALAARLVRGQLRNGMWSYRLDRGRTSAGEKNAVFAPPATGDNSNSQLAVLALWSAMVLAEYRVPRGTWQRVAALYERTQQPGGGWTYADPDDRTARPRIPGVRPAMTVAGLVGYVCARAALHGGIEGLEKARDEEVAARGLAAFLAGRDRFDYRDYYLVYGIERVGTILDLPSATWYSAGAQRLLPQQRRDGRFASAGGRGDRARGGHGDAAQVYETALALLFLSRATVHPITPRPGGENGR